MSRYLCIRQCGRRRSPPSPLCSTCQGRERDKLYGQGRLRRLNERQREFYGLPKRIRNVGYYG